MTSGETLIAQILADSDIYYKCGLEAKDFVQPKERRAFTAISHILDNNNALDIVAVVNQDKRISASWLASLTFHTTKNY